ncbi:SAM-dependent methyltransferase [Streptomyces sp. NPDC051320]|uniref:SAM-dependent methyltransferase n=1 Tax=Streptomyces sp. NPDC051320 TaxID=3154644 RepID=UPI003441C52A
MAGTGHDADPIDTTKPHSARMYDYYLDGKDHYEVDQEAAAQVLAVFPSIKICARTNRQFMHRATRWITAHTDVRQFLDVGTGIPTQPNLHQIAQETHPESRVVYVDYDPVVLRHAQALMRSKPEGRTAYIQADVREPETITSAELLHQTLDLSRPVALSLNALLHFVPDERRPYEIVQHLVDALAPGSYLMMSHCTPDFDPEAWEKILDVYRAGGIEIQVRSRKEVLGFFDGLEFVEPGLEVPHRWQPDGETLSGATDAAVSLYAGVARKR